MYTSYITTSFTLPSYTLPSYSYSVIRSAEWLAVSSQDADGHKGRRGTHCASLYKRPNSPPSCFSPFTSTSIPISYPFLFFCSTSFSTSHHILNPAVVRTRYRTVILRDATLRTSISPSAGTVRTVRTSNFLFNYKFNTMLLCSLFILFLYNLIFTIFYSHSYPYLTLILSPPHPFLIHHIAHPTHTHAL